PAPTGPAEGFGNVTVQRIRRGVEALGKRARFAYPDLSVNTLAEFRPTVIRSVWRTDNLNGGASSGRGTSSGNAMTFRKLFANSDGERTGAGIDQPMYVGSSHQMVSAYFTPDWS
ncbi:MAG: hypothetical protein ABIR32_14375, partial [Ilumatobacteraceae bacterium]